MVLTQWSWPTFVILLFPNQTPDMRERNKLWNGSKYWHGWQGRQGLEWSRWTVSFSCFVFRFDKYLGNVSKYNLKYKIYLWGNGSPHLDFQIRLCNLSSPWQNIYILYYRERFQQQKRKKKKKVWGNNNNCSTTYSPKMKCKNWPTPIYPKQFVCVFVLLFWNLSVMRIKVLNNFIWMIWINLLP